MKKCITVFNSLKSQLMRTIVEQEWHESLLWILVLMFPVLITVEHGASIVFYLMILISFITFTNTDTKINTISKFLLYGFILLFIISLVSLVNTEDIGSGLSRLKKLVNFMSLLLFFPALTAVRKNLVLPYVIGSCIGGLVVFGISVYQVHIQEMERATGYYNLIMFGSMSTLLALSNFIGIFTFRHNKLFTIFLFFSLAGALYATLLSGARGSWVGILGGVPLGLFMVGKELPKKEFIQILFFFSLLFISGGLIGKNIIVKRVWDATLQYMDWRGTERENLGGIGERLFLWESAIKIWYQEPILGSGLGDFEKDFKDMVIKGEIESPEMSQITPVYAHSVIFEKLAGTGIIGFLIMIGATLILPSMLFIKTKKSTDIICDFYAAVFGVVFIVAFFLFGLTENWLAHKQLVITYCLLLAIMGSRFASR